MAASAVVASLLASVSSLASAWCHRQAWILKSRHTADACKAIPHTKTASPDATQDVTKQNNFKARQQRMAAPLPRSSTPSTVAWTANAPRLARALNRDAKEAGSESKWEGRCLMHLCRFQLLFGLPLCPFCRLQRGCRFACLYMGQAQHSQRWADRQVR